MERETVKALNAPAAVGPYVHAVKAGGFVFTSGQLGLDPKTNTLPDGVEAQARQALVNIGEVLRAAGCTYADVIKTTVFLADINDFAAINRIYSEFLPEMILPARSCVQHRQQHFRRVAYLKLKSQQYAKSRAAGNLNFRMVIQFWWSIWSSPRRYLQYHYKIRARDIP